MGTIPFIYLCLFCGQTRFTCIRFRIRCTRCRIDKKIHEYDGQWKAEFVAISSFLVDRSTCYIVLIHSTGHSTAHACATWHSQRLLWTAEECHAVENINNNILKIHERKNKDIKTVIKKSKILNKSIIRKLDNNQKLSEALTCNILSITFHVYFY
jgi:hypothetical protein